MKTKPFSQAALSLAVALALSACAAPKANPNLTLEATGQVMSAAETAERYDVNGNWWEIYQSPQLNALMEQALANNVDLKQAAISVNKALYQANILGADLVPSFSGSLGANASKNLKTGSHGNTFSSQLGLSYELDLWRKLSATADAQVWEYQATHEDMANTRLTLINNVADAYFNIAYLNEAIELAQKSLKQYQEINRIKETKFGTWDWNYGKSPEFNVRRGTKFTSGKVEVFANVIESKIQDIKIYGDFFGIEDVAAVEDVLRGVKYEREDVFKALETIDITRYFAGISREEIAEAVVG